MVGTHFSLYKIFVSIHIPVPVKRLKVLKCIENTFELLMECTLLYTFFKGNKSKNPLLASKFTKNQSNNTQKNDDNNNIG